MSKNIVDILNEMEREIDENIKEIERICIEQAYPVHGSNFSLMEEEWNNPLRDEINKISLDHSVVWDDERKEWTWKN